MTLAEHWEPNLFQDCCCWKFHWCCCDIRFIDYIFRIGVLHENQAPTGPETKQGFKNKSKKVKKGEEKSKKAITDTKTALDFFRDIPTSKIKRLYQHYKEDFEIFGYSAEEYLNIE